MRFAEFYKAIELLKSPLQTAVGRKCCYFAWNSAASGNSMIVVSLSKVKQPEMFDKLFCELGAREIHFH